MQRPRPPLIGLARRVDGRIQQVPLRRGPPRGPQDGGTQRALLQAMVCTIGLRWVWFVITGE